MRSIRCRTLLLAAVLAACGADQDSDKPYLKFLGGGFIFNYRLAQADYGFVAGVKRPLPSGAILEAEFEDPGGGTPIIVRHSTKWGRTSYTFRTPPVRGVKAKRDYHVELRVVDPNSNQVIARYTKTYRSDVDQDILPETPTVVGPGHQPAPRNRRLK